MRFTRLHAATAALVFALLAALAGIAAPPPAPPRPASDATTLVDYPQACIRELDNTEWLLDPCVPPGGQLPQNVVDTLAQRALAAASPCASATPSATTSSARPTATATTNPGVPQAEGLAVATGTAPGSPSASPSRSASASPSGSPCPSSSASSSPSGSPSRSASSSPSASKSASASPSASKSASASPSASKSASASPSASKSASASPSASKSASASPSASKSASASPSASPSASKSPSASSSGQPSDPPTTETSGPGPDPTGTGKPSGCPNLTGTPDLQDALKDRIRCRDQAQVNNPVVLTATGDSVTSSHFQWGFGMPPCAQTSADQRNLPGNDGVFSYVRRYFDLNGSIVDYENFARTGFDTGYMLSAGPATADACTNPWARGSSPIGLSMSRIAKAKADGHQAWHVTTGGANNTNWATILSRLVECRGMEYAASQLPASLVTFNWATPNGKAGIITDGGGCTLWFKNPNPFGTDRYYNVDVPRYNGNAATLAALTNDVDFTINMLLGAGADKVVWMLYYDITPAQIDIGNFAWVMMRSVMPSWAVGYLAPRATPYVVPLIDPLWVPAVKTLISDINFAIWAGVPFDDHVRVGVPPAFGAADIQTTGAGGSPHPSAAGQDKLAATAASAFNDIP